MDGTTRTSSKRGFGVYYTYSGITAEQWLAIEQAIQQLIVLMKWPYQHQEDPLSLWNAPIPEISQWYETYEKMQPKENPLEQF